MKHTVVTKGVRKKRFPGRPDSGAMTIIGLVGKQGSGKSTVSDVLVKKSFDVVSMGDVVRGEAERRGLGGDALGQISTELREEHGPTAVAELLLERQDLSGDVVIDGLRSDAEVELFREELEGFFLVAVTASQETRYERITGRGRSDDPESYEAFVEKEEREDSWGLDAAISMADLEVENEAGLEELGQKAATVPAKSVRVRISAPIAPTETVERVSRAIDRLFPDVELEERDGELVGEGFGSDLSHFRERVFEQRVIDTVRKELEEGRTGSRTVVELDKQAAWMDRVNFDVGSSLGPIRLEVEGRLDDFVKWVSPPTVEGKPVETA